LCRYLGWGRSYGWTLRLILLHSRLENELVIGNKKEKKSKQENEQFLIHKNYRTGSRPPFEKGLHLKIRLIPRKVPFHAPYREIASYIYSEHVGVKRQEGISRGERKRLYPRSNASRVDFPEFLVTAGMFAALCGTGFQTIHISVPAFLSPR